MQPLKGFSLIELMIVVAIISILAAIGIPSYEGYTKRARFVEVIEATEPYKIAIAVALQMGATLNDIQSGTYNIPEDITPTKNLESLTVKNGIITAKGTALVDNKTYMLHPDKNGNVWTVEGSCLTAGLCNG